MHRRSVALVLLVLAPVGLLVAKELYERAWIEARSPNFVVASALGEKDTVAAVGELEDFRQVVGFVTNISMQQERVPTFVYIFPGAVPEIGLQGGIGGYLLPTMRANYAVLRPMSSMKLLEILQHEYTHFLVRNRGPQAYPRWFDEGFAELLSTVKVSEGRFEMGTPASVRADWLHYGAWLPFSRIVDDEWSRGDIGDRAQAMFYAHSWALVHYLYLGPGAANVSSRTQDYLQRIERGGNPGGSFEAAYGERLENLGQRIEHYLPNARGMVASLRAPFPAARVQISPMAVYEVAAAVGRLALLRRNSQEARRYVDVALATKPDHAPSLVMRAELDKSEQRYAEAESGYQRALALEPDSDLHHLDFGEYYLNRAEATGNPAQRAGFLKRARKQFVLAETLNDKNPEVLAMYGHSFQLPGEPVEKGLEALKLANVLLPSERNISLLLAQSYLALNRPKEAVPLLRTVVAWAEGEDVSDARRLLAGIEGEAPAQPAPAPAGTE